MLAGYETSSVCILWTLYLLSTHPEIQEKLANEVINTIGKDKLPNGIYFFKKNLKFIFTIILSLTFFHLAEDIDKMPYLFNVLRESLRFCPPIPYVYRRASEDVNLGGYTIPKNVLSLSFFLCFLFIYIFHPLRRL